MSICIEFCEPELYQAQNVIRKLDGVRKKASLFVQRVYRFRRVPATHMFVLMISPAHRRKKPYAIPVQCVPYDGLKEKDIRRLISELAKVMKQNGMKVAGTDDNLMCVFVNDNYLCMYRLCK